MIAIARLRRTALGLSLLAVAACDPSVGFSSLGEQHRLRVARERWIDRAPASYSFTMARICFCLELPAMRVTVVNGAVTSVRPVGGGDELTGSSRDAFRPILALFGTVSDAIDDDAYSIRAVYDPALGFPADVFIDYRRDIADEERGFAVRDVSFP
jgi:Family of unknown function (DUF6174)